MVNMLKGLAVVLVTLFLFALSQGVQAQVPPHQVLHKGKCSFDGADINPADEGKYCKIIMTMDGQMLTLVYGDPPENPVEIFRLVGPNTFQSVWKVAVKEGKMV